MTVPNTAATAAAIEPDKKKKKVIFKNLVTFTDRTREINNTEIDLAKDIDVVMPMYNFIEYSHNYLKILGRLWQYHRDKPNLNDNGVVIDFPDDTDNASLKFKQKITGNAGNDGTNDFQIMVPLRYLSNFWRTLEMSLVNFEINLDLNSSEKCVIVTTVVANQGATFSIALRKLYVAAMTLSACDNGKLLQQLKAGYKRTIN